MGQAQVRECNLSTFQIYQHSNTSARQGAIRDFPNLLPINNQREIFSVYQDFEDIDSSRPLPLMKLASEGMMRQFLPGITCTRAIIIVPELVFAAFFIEYLE